jgi:ArsR family transcriptional regulator
MSTSNHSNSIPRDGSQASLQSAGMARVCKAMGHPVRLQIIAFLKAKKRCFCGQIVNHLPLAQSTVSQHLKYLKNAGIIIGQVEGPGTHYCLNHKLLKQFQSKLATFLD